jgi:DNA repair protein RecN (Recombination protein N)
LTHSEEIFSRANEIYSLLYESEISILSQSNRVARVIEELERLDPGWTPFRESVSEARFKLEDLAYFARDYTTKINFSPERLDQIEQRLSDLDRLGRKYGHSEAAVLQYADKCEQELQELNSHSERLQQLEEQLRLDLAGYVEKAETLSGKRRNDARLLERQIKKELQALSMDKTDFQVQFRPREESEARNEIPNSFRPDGIDRLEFMVSPNKGEELKPLARIASGGELSRIILALKTICGGDDSAKTLVFDEVDAGIGGRVAEAVGRRLRDISASHQVLCVTHLPQIAAFATSHYRVSKAAVGSRTETTVRLLDESERVEELSRMLGGETITETTREHAREMLAYSLGAAGKK